MAQLEYGDYYKFTASAGITLIAGAVVVPWMFLREPFDLAMEASKIALLTPDAQNIIHTRQHLVTVAIHFLPLGSGLMAVAGACLTVFGLLSWRTRQAVGDEIEDLQRKKLDRELTAMSPGEIEAKPNNEPEIAEDVETGQIELQASASTRTTSVLAVEQALLGRIGSCLGPSMQVMSNKRLGNVEYDAIIRASNTHQIIVEIKYIRKGFNSGWVLESMNNLSLKMAIYSKTFDENVSGLMLVVIATSNSPLSRRLADIAQIMRYSHPSQLENIRVQTIDEADIATISCEDLRQFILA